MIPEIRLKVANLVILSTMNTRIHVSLVLNIRKLSYIFELF